MVGVLLKVWMDKDIASFVERSLGHWRSQRSAHHMALSHFEEVRSEIDIVSLSPSDPEVVELCKVCDIDPAAIVRPFRMSWQGESDWDEEESLEGSSVLVPVPDPDDGRRGRLLRDRGYAETMTATSTYSFTEDGTFVLVSAYDRAAAEERIWFGTPNVRFRVSLIRTSDGKGVVTASFASEIRTSKNIQK